MTKWAIWSGHSDEDENVEMDWDSVCVCGRVPSYLRGVGVCARCDGTRGAGLEDIRWAHHHVKLTWKEKKMCI